MDFSRNEPLWNARFQNPARVDGIRFEITTDINAQKAQMFSARLVSKISNYLNQVFRISLTRRPRAGP